MTTIAGKLVLVVGASGAGKDTLIDYARMLLKDDPRVHFVRRVINRPVTTSEIHEPVDDLEFERRVLKGRFALNWEAHGNRYGIPSEINGRLERGDVVVANGSRGMLATACERSPGLLAVHITVPPDILTERLAARGRETEDEIRQRLLRSEQTIFDSQSFVEIDNSGAPEIGGERLVTAICNQRQAAIGHSWKVGPIRTA